SDRRVRLALPAATTDVTVLAGGVLSTAEPTASPLVVTVPPVAEEIVVSARTPSGPARFVLAVAPPSELAWLIEARALKAAGDHDGARAIAEARLDASDPLASALA